MLNMLIMQESIRIEQLNREISELRAENALLKKQVEELTASNLAYQRVIAGLMERIVQLEKKVEGGSADDDDNNDDDEPPPNRYGSDYLEKVKKKPGKQFGKVKKKKCRGAKKGHKGHGRSISEEIDREVNLTLEVCPDCGGRLEENRDPGEYVKEDLVTTKVATKYLVHRYQCEGCRKEVQPAYQQGFIGDLAESLSTLIHYHCGVPFNKIREIFNWFELMVSEGSLALWGRKLSEKLSGCYENLRETLRKAPYVNADETGWPIDGKNHWLWVFQSADSVLFTIDASRGSRVVEDVLGSDYGGVLCSDFYSAYNPIDVKKQKCLVHLLRAVKDWKESGSIENRLLRYGIDRLFEDAVKLSKKRDEMAADVYLGRVKKFGDDFGGFLKTTFKDADCRRIMKRLRKHSDELWTFLSEDVPYHNNHAELAIRRSVVNRKVSYGNRSESGAGVQEILMSIIQTAKLQGKNLLKLMLNPTLHQVCAT